jgi:hypothetical protein
LLIAGVEAGDHLKIKKEFKHNLGKNTRQHAYLIWLGMTCQFFRKQVKLYRNYITPEVIVLEKKLTNRIYGEARMRKRQWQQTSKRLQARNNLTRMIAGTFAESPEFEQVQIIMDIEAQKRTSWDPEYIPKLTRTIEMARFPLYKRIIAIEVFNNSIVSGTDENDKPFEINIDMTEHNPSRTVFQIVRGSDQFTRTKGSKYRVYLEQCIQKWLKLGVIGTMFHRNTGDLKYQYVESKVVYTIDKDEVIFYIKL